MELTQEYIKQIFDYREDGKLLWKVTMSNRAIAGSVAGCQIKEVGYQQSRIVIRLNNTMYGANRLVFLYHKGYLPPVVDHIDRNPLNDRIDNLRAATKAQNSKNMSKKKGSFTSKYIGVSAFKNKWVATISINGKQTFLGYFETEYLAANARNEAAIKHHGEFANLNII